MKWIKSLKVKGGKIKATCSKGYACFRKILLKLQTRHPQLYQFGYKGTLWLIDMLPILLSASDISSWKIVCLLVVAFFSGTMLYGATLKNKYDAMIENELRSMIDTLDDQEKKLEEYKIKSSLMYYQLAQSISDGCSYMLQEGADKEDRLLRDLANLANTIELTLTKHYKYPVAVNIKLVVPGDSVRTYARGKNNIVNRGGEHIIFDLNSKSTPIANNYALNLIVRSQIDCFIEGDLVNMETAFEVEDMFSCDRENWQDYFNSTAIFAIRGRTRHQPYKYNMTYEVYGFICIDAKETNKWCKSEDCIVYTFGAFCANLLYEYLSVYKAATENKLQRGVE